MCVYIRYIMCRFYYASAFTLSFLSSTLKSWSSFANSSRDKPFVSGMSIENKPPINIHAAKIKSNCPTNAFGPPMSFSFEKPT